MINVTNEELEKMIDEKVSLILSNKLSIELHLETNRDFYSPGHVDINARVKLFVDGKEISTGGDSTSFSTNY